MKLVGNKEIGFSESTFNIINYLHDKYDIEVTCEDTYNPRQRILIVKNNRQQTYTRCLINHVNDEYDEKQLENHTRTILKGIIVAMMLIEGGQECRYLMKK